MAKKALTISALFSVLLVASGGVVVAQSIYFTGTNSNEIWIANKDGSGTPSVLFSNAASSTQGPVGIEWIPSTGKIYYAGGNNQEVWVANADGTGTPAQLANTMNIAQEHHDVSVDLANNRIFFTTRVTIQSGNLDGSGTSTPLISSGGLVSVAYDPASDKMYYADQDNFATNPQSISVANGDGTSPSVLFDAADGVSQPRDIAIDPDNDKIYWTDRGGSILSGNIDGSGSPVTLFSGLDIPRGLDIDRAAGELYWVEFQAAAPGTDEIVKGNADGSGTPTILFAGDFGGVRGISLGSSQSVSVPATSPRMLILLGVLLLIATSAVVMIRLRRREDLAGLG